MESEGEVDVEGEEYSFTSVQGHAGVRGLHQVLQQRVRVLLLVHEDDDGALLLVVSQDLQQL